MTTYYIIISHDSSNSRLGARSLFSSLKDAIKYVKCITPAGVPDELWDIIPLEVVIDITKACELATREREENKARLKAWAYK